MINPTREQVAVALFALLSNVPGIKYASRRPQMWSNATAMPALYLGNSLEEYAYHAGTATPPHVTLTFDVFLYVNAGEDPNTTPDIQVNMLLDAIEAKMQPVPGVAQALGGIADHAWIEGSIHRAPGYLDGQGLVLFTIKVLVPQ